MKRKQIFGIAIILAIVLLSWLVWPRHEAPTELAGRQTPDSFASAHTVQSNGASEQRGKTPTAVEYIARGIQREVEMHNALERSKDEWRTPIEFYGKVVDEIGEPVIAAQIKFVCNDLSKEGTSFYNRTSDLRGLFNITGISGKGMSVHVNKEGYYTSKLDNDSFEYGDRYSHFTPDASNPVLFHLKKKGVAEPLVHIPDTGLRAMRDFLLTPDGKPVEISLRDGKASPVGQGDFRVEYWADSPQNGSRSFLWKFRLIVPGGGLQPTSEQFPFQAPESGYAQSDEHAFAPDIGDWKDEFEGSYFIQLRDAKFARMRIRILASPTKPYFRVESFLNPSGSRNLEYDPALK